MTKFLAAVAASLILCGCAATTKLDWYGDIARERLRPGMTETEVVAAMGMQPDQRVAQGDKVALVWSSYRETLMLFFRNGKLTDLPKAPAGS